MKQHNFLLCLPQSKQTAAFPSPSLAGVADGPFEAKLPTSWWQKGNEAWREQLTTSSCVAGFIGILLTTHSSIAPLCRPQSHGQCFSTCDHGIPSEEHGFLSRNRTFWTKWGTHVFADRFTHLGKEGLKLGTLGKDCYNLGRSESTEGREEAAGVQHNREGFCTPLVKVGQLRAHLKMPVHQCKYHGEKNRRNWMFTQICSAVNPLGWQSCGGAALRTGSAVQDGRRLFRRDGLVRWGNEVCSLQRNGWSAPSSGRWTSWDLCRKDQRMSQCHPVGWCLLPTTWLRRGSGQRTGLDR